MRHENKFKVGDRVRAIHTSGGGGVQAGDVFVVTKSEDGYLNFFNHRVGRDDGWGANYFELALTIEPGKHYRTRSGKPTGPVTVGDTGFEAVVDGRVRIFDKAGGAVHGDDGIVEAWVPKVGERVVEAEPRRYDLVGHWYDFWQGAEGPIVDDAFVVTKVSGNFVHYSNRVGGNGPQATLDCFEPLPVPVLPVAAPQPAAELKIEAGKFYRTRDGRKVEPMDGPDLDGDYYFGGFYRDTGHWMGEERNKDYGKHLIVEWVDEPVAVAAPAVAEASNDNKPKFKVGDRVFARYGDLCGNGTVTRVDTSDDDMPYLVDFGAEGTFWCYDEDVTSPQPEAENDNKPLAEQPAAPLKIEAGRYYKTRDGRKVGPMEPAKHTDGWYDAATRVTSRRWEKDGAFIPGEPSALDLIAEWVDEPAAPVSAQVDAIAEEYGPVVPASGPTFKIGDRVVFRNYSGSEHCYGTVEDVSMDGKRVLASDWSVGAEVGYLPVADLELADKRPDTTLHIKFTSDFSELDAAILVRKKKLKKLIKLARKAGIELREAA